MAELTFRDALVGISVLSTVETFAINKLAPNLHLADTFTRTLCLFVSANLALYSLYQLFIFPHFVCPTRHFRHGPKTWNIFTGHLISFFTHTPPGRLVREWTDDVPNDGIIRVRSFFGTSFLVLTGPAALKSVLVDHAYDYEKPKLLSGILKLIIGEGLVVAEGDLHKFQRKHLLPSFQVPVIKDLHPVFWTKACELSSRLEETTTQHEFEFTVWCTRVTLDIIGIGLGHDFNSLKNPDDEFVRMYQDLLEVNPYVFVFFLLAITLGIDVVLKIPFWEVPREAKRIAASLRGFAYNLARTRRAELNNPKMSAEDRNRRHDILSHLVKSGDFSDDDLAQQILTFMAAGSETSANTLTWAIFCISQQPNLMKDLRAEIRANLPSPENVATETISAAAFENMPLLNAICNETLRLYPLVPITDRNVAVPSTTLEGVRLPKGTVVYISPWAINRNKHVWGKDAEEFVPQRWIGSDGKVNNTGGARSNYDLMTFLHGPRSCIGQGFAKAELRCLIAAVIGRYDVAITRNKDLYFPAGVVTTKPAHGMWLTLTREPGW